MPSIIQRSFAAGEIAPALYARADQVRYATGLRTCRNFQVLKYGGVANRAGTRFIAETKGGGAVRLIRFVFNDDQTYVMEWGHEYIRWYRQGERIGVDLFNMPGWNSSTVYEIGDLVRASGERPLDPDRAYYCMQRHANADPPSNPDKWHELEGSIYEIPTPYTLLDLPRIRTIQSADVVTVLHPDHPPRELRRYGHNNWRLDTIRFEPGIDHPTNLSVTRGQSGDTSVRYRVTAVAEETLEESLIGIAAPYTITGATQADPVVITTSENHGGVGELENGDVVRIDGVVGMEELNGRDYVVANKTATTFELKGVDGTGYGAYISGGTATRLQVTIRNAGNGLFGNPHVVTWDPVPGAMEYNVYKSTTGTYGFAGVAEDDTRFEDPGITEDTGRRPPIPRDPFEDGNHPSVGAYYQQRLVLANSLNDPAKVWASVIGNFHNFNIRSPLQDDDAVTFALGGREVNQVMHLLDLGTLVVLARAGIFVATGDANGVLLPATINLKQQSHHGAAAVPEPVVVGNSGLYVQARRSIVRDLRYQFDSDSYTGNDLTLFSAHLFEGHQIEQWTYQETPHSIVWAIREDGTLLGCTYVPEQQIVGWHRHDTLGRFESITCVPEGDEDAVYVVVARDVEGTTRRYIERMETRLVRDVRDAFFVDFGLSYDGRNADNAHTMTLSGSGWTPADDLVLTSSTGFFSSGDVGNAIALRSGDAQVICSITGYTSPTVVTVRVDKVAPEAMRGIATSDWGRMVDQVAGLEHLEGCTVSILADGNVEPQQVVAAGAVSLSRPYERIHVGLPITADFETLDVDDPQGQTLVDRRKVIAAVALMVEASRGIFAGPDQDHLTELRQREHEPYGEPIELRTGTVEVRIDGRWSRRGRVFVRQADPLPLTILAAIPQVQIGGA